MASPEWYGISATTHIGAVTWGNGATGTTGAVGTGNSVVGVNQDDAVGSGGVTALADGAFVIESPGWDAFFDNVGAVTWFDGTGPVTGTVTAANSLVGTRFDAETGGRTRLLWPTAATSSSRRSTASPEEPLGRCGRGVREERLNPTRWTRTTVSTP